MGFSIELCYLLSRNGNVRKVNSVTKFLKLAAVITYCILHSCITRFEIQCVLFPGGNCCIKFFFKLIKLMEFSFV